MLIDDLVKTGWLKTARIIGAFQKIKRIDFVTEEEKDLSEYDTALAIGYGQTISQPLTVAFMLEKLDPKPGNKVLDVGSGSGWTSALLAEIVTNGNEKGRVVAVEIIPELAEFGKENISKYNFIEKGVVELVCGDGSKGYEKDAPYDRILASASAFKKIPEAWKEQLKVGGKIVAPVENSIWLFFKKAENEFEQFEFPGFVFVPLIEK